MGILANVTPISYSSTQGMGVGGCVIGPGLSYGVRFTGNAGIWNSLLIDATLANVQGTTSPTYPALPGLSMYSCTSFMTKLNPSNQAHYCVQGNFGPNNAYLQNSIFYGGAVGVPLTAMSQYNNFNIQYAVTGSTTWLGAAQANPQFIAPVADFPNNVPINVLTSANFAKAPSDLETGLGSPVTSVQQLLASFEP